MSTGSDRAPGTPAERYPHIDILGPHSETGWVAAAGLEHQRPPVQGARLALSEANRLVSCRSLVLLSCFAGIVR